MSSIYGNDKYGIGDKLKEYTPMRRQMREFAKHIKVEGRHPTILIDGNGAERVGTLQVDDRNGRVDFLSDDFGIVLADDVVHYDYRTSYIFAKPTAEGVTSIVKVNISAEEMIYCNYFYGILSCQIDITSVPKAHFYLDESTRITEEKFQYLLKKAHQLYKCGLIPNLPIEGNRALNWENIEPFANEANALLNGDKANNIKIENKAARKTELCFGI